MTKQLDSQPTNKNKHDILLCTIGLIITLTGAGWGVLLLELNFDKIIATGVSIAAIAIGGGMLCYWGLRGIPKE